MHKRPGDIFPPIVTMPKVAVFLGSLIRFFAKAFGKELSPAPLTELFGVVEPGADEQA